MSATFDHFKQKTGQLLLNHGIKKSAHLEEELDYLLEEFRNQHHLQEKQNQQLLEINRHLYKEAPNPLITLNHTGAIVELNMAASRLLNAIPEEVHHKSIFEWIPEESVSWFKNALEELFQSSRLNDGELLLKSADGKLHYTRLHAFCLFDHHRQEPLCHCTFVEIDQKEEQQGSKQLIELERDKYKQAVTDLNKSQALAKIGIWKWYVQENRLDWSDEMFRIFEIDKASFTGNSAEIMNTRIHPDDKSRVEEINRIIAESGNKITIEYRIILPNGSVKYIRAESGEMFRDENNQVILSTGIVQDITERKFAELEMAQMTEKLREQTEVLDLAHVLIRDMDNHIVYWNQGMEKLYGWSKEEALGKATHHFFQTRFPEPFGQYQQTLMEKGSWEGELVHTTRSGAQITVASHHTIYRNAQGKPALILEVNNDITALKQTEEKLRKNERHLRTKNEEYAALNEEYASINEEYLSANEELRQTVEELSLTKDKIEESEARYRLIAENTADVIWVLNPLTQKFTYVSPSVEKLRGYTPEEVMSQPVHEALTPESFKLVSESLTATLPQFMEQGRGTLSFLTEIDQPHKNGNIVNTEVTTTYVFNKKGEVEIVGVSRDISERKRAEEKIKEASDFLDAIFKYSSVAKSIQRISDKVLIDINQAGEKLFGVERSEMIGKPTFDLIKWALPEQRQKAFQLFNKQGYLYDYELLCLDQQGKPRVLSIFTRVVELYNQKYTLNEYLDITDRKNIETQLRENERTLTLKNEEYAALNEEYAALNEEYASANEELKQTNEELYRSKEILQLSQENFSRAFMSNATALAITSYNEGRFMELNPAYCSIVKYSREELIGKTVADFDIYITITDREKVLDQLNKQSTGSRLELTIRNKSGEIRYIIANQVIISYYNEKAILTTILDITDRKLAEEKLLLREQELQIKNEEYASIIEELRQTNEELLLTKLKIEESEYRYHSILNNMLEGCQILDFDWTYLYINDAAEKHNQRPKEELLGKRYMDMWPGIEDTEVFEHIKRCLEDRLPYKFENKFVFPNGSLGYFELSIQPVSEGVFILSVDITERKKAEFEIKHKNEEYAALNEELRFSNTEVLNMKNKIEEAFTKLKKANDDLNKAQQVAKIGSWKWNLTENKLEWSDEMYNIFEMNKEKFNGSIAEVMITRIHPEDIEKVEYANRMIMEKGIPVPIEYRLLIGNGNIKTVWAEAGELIKDEEGKPLALSGIVQDITERVKIQEKLVTSEERYRLLVDNYPDGSVSVFDRSLSLTFVSGTDLEKLNMDLETLKGTKFWELVPESTYKIAEPILQDAFNGKSGYYETSWDNLYFQVNVAPIQKNNSPVEEVLVITQDISKRKKLEQEKEDKDILYRTLIEKSFDIILLLDVNGKAVFVSPSVKNILEFEPEELIGIHYSATIHPDDLPLMDSLFKQLVSESGQSINFRARLKQKNSSYRWIEGVATNLLTDPVVKAIVINFQDITERKVSQDKLLASEERYRRLVENFPDGTVTLYDRNYQLRFVAGSELQKYNSTPEDFIGKTFRELTSSDTYERAFPVLEAAFMGQTGHYETTYWNNRYYQVSVAPLRKADGTIDEILVLSQNITERKQAEYLAHEKEKQFRLLFENAPEPMFIQLQGKFAYVNKAAVNLYQASSADELINTPILNRIHPDYKAAVAEKIKNLNENKLNVRNFEYRQITMNHIPIDVEVTAVPVRFNNEDGALVFVKDITARKKAEEQIKTSERNLKLFVEYAPAAIAMFDTNMRYIAASKRFLIDYNLTDPNIIGKSHYEIFPEIGEDWKTIHSRCLTGIIEKREEDPFPRLDGSIDWVRWEIHPWYEKPDKIGGILLFSEVITQRKSAEQAVKLSEERLRQISEHSHAVVWEVDASGLYTYVSPMSKNVWGYEPEELINKKHYYDLHPAKNRENFKKETLEFFAQKEGFQDFQNPVTCSNGKIKWMNTNGIPILDKNQNLLGYRGSDNDITERMLAEIALKNSEEKFRKLFETIQLGVTFQDEKGKILMMNQAAEAIFGGSIEDMNNYLRTNGMHKAYKEDGVLYKKQEHPCYISVKTGQPATNYVMQITRLNTNEQIWINKSAIPVKNQDTGEQFVYTIIEDISERVKFDKESRKLRTAFTQSSSSFLITNEKGVIEDLNVQTEIITGYNRNEILSKTPALFKSNLHNKTFYRNLWKTIQSGNTWEGQLCNRNKNGDLYWIFLVISPIRNEKGIITHYFATSNDITQQKKDREELLKYREHLEKLVKERTQEANTVSSKLLNLIYSMPLGYIETNLKGEIIAFNHSAEQIFGSKSKNVIGQPLHQVFSFEKENIELLQNTTERIKVFVQDHLLKNKRINCRWNVVDLTFNKSTLIGFAYIIEDISKMKQAEQSLQYALYKERELNELKSGFVSMTSHQFRTPLTTILSNTEMLEELIKSLKEEETQKGRRFVKRIYDNIERLDLLMSDVLLLGKSQAGKINFRPQSIKLSNFIRSLIADTKFPHQNNRGTLLSIEGAEQELFADPQLLAHIVHNLLSNAFKYSKEDVELKIEYQKKTVHIKIKDYGIGVPPEDQSKLFSSFFRASNTENMSGTGLGLVIVKEYVEMHKGNISFTSKLNEGTEFTVELPYTTNGQDISK